MDIPHCPNPSCGNFDAPRTGKWYQRYGYHHTKAFGTVQRFQCTTCKKTFSTQTFHAERAGVSATLLQSIIDRHWMRRCFLHKQDLGVEERTTWLCGWRNPGVPLGRYIPKYIYV